MAMSNGEEARNAGVILANVKLFAVTGGDDDKMICLDLEKKVRPSLAGGRPYLKKVAS